MPRRVAVAGVGVTRHVAYNVEKTWKEMVADAAFEALDDGGLEPGDIEGGVVACLGEPILETGNIGPLVADTLGMAPAGMTGISGACSGGSMAFYHGYALVASGLCDAAMVVGLEKGSELYEYIETICPSSDTEYDYTFGLTHLDWLVLMTKRYAEKYALDWEAVIQWVMDRHRSARQHPKSFYFGQPMPSRDDFMRNMYYLASARADGAAATVLVSEELAARLGRPPVWVDGLGFASASAYLPHKFHFGGHGWADDGTDIGDSELTRLAAGRAYRMAGLASPAEADLLQVSDGAPAIAFMEIEALGLAERGSAWRSTLEGRFGPSGELPSNTHGGSIAFGHASGAAALVNVVEAVAQMRGTAGDRQLDRRIGTCICQSSGGSNSNNVVTVLRQGEA